MKSEFNILRGDAGVIPLMFIVLVVFLGNYLINYTTIEDADFFIVFFPFVIVLLGHEIFKKRHVIIITSKEISFRHVFLRTKNTYLFSELDGFKARLEIPKEKYYDVVWIIKDGKKVKQIFSLLC